MRENPKLLDIAYASWLGSGERKGLRRSPETWSKPMNVVNGATLRRLIPAFVVGGVFAFSFLAQVPSLASNNDAGYGYGYANNCGVKGDGFHDHGKVCPNRPFPGHGTGVLRILGISLAQSQSTGNGVGHANGKARSDVSVTAAVSNASSGSEDADDSTGLINGHGHSHSNNGHGRGK